MFRPTRSTTPRYSLLLTGSGFNQHKPHTQTLAFDTVPHDLLIGCIIATVLHPNTKRWLSTYLRGRFACCSYLRACSGYHSTNTGVPQGSVISPCLFNSFIPDYPHSADFQVSYADDFTAVKIFPWCVQGLSSPLPARRPCQQLGCGQGSHHLQPKVARHPSELIDRGVSMGAELISLCRIPQILGITFDTHFTLAPMWRNTVA